MTTEPKKLWLIMKTWQTGKQEFCEAWFSEEKARYSASQMITGEAPYYSIHLVEVKDD